MVLFVARRSVVFSFSLPAGTAEEASYGLFWVALLFTAILGLTCRPRSSEQRLLDGLILAPCDRSAIWLGRRSRCSRFRARRGRRAPASHSSSRSRGRWSPPSCHEPGRLGGHSSSSAMAAASRARELLLPLLLLPLAILIASASAPRSPTIPGASSGFLALYDLIRDPVLGEL